MGVNRINVDKLLVDLWKVLSSLGWNEEDISKMDPKEIFDEVCEHYLGDRLSGYEIRSWIKNINEASREGCV